VKLLGASGEQQVPEAAAVQVLALPRDPELVQVRVEFLEELPVGDLLPEQRAFIEDPAKLKWCPVHLLQESELSAPEGLGYLPGWRRLQRGRASEAARAEVRPGGHL